MKSFKEYAMTSRQQITQMQRYWTDLSHLASDDAKKKSMDSRFGIQNIKLDKKGKKIISYKTERGKLVAGDDCDCFGHELTEAEYQGKKVKLNDPIRTSENPNKKFKVYVKNAQGKVVVVRFGDPNMEIKRDDPKRRAAFRARHNCADKKDKTTPGYWSCMQWRAGAKVDN